MKKSRYFKLGLFIVVGVALLCAAVITLGATHMLENHITAATLFDESIGGLDVGVPVKFRGVTIGRVSSIEFAKDKHGGVTAQAHKLSRYILVELSLDAKAFKGMTLQEICTTLQDMASQGLRARVTQQGLGGGVYLGLDFAQDGGTPAPEVHLASNAVYIPSAPSTMNQVMSAAERLASDLQKANLPQIVQHIDGLVTSATGTVGQVNHLVQGNQGNIQTAISNLPAITDDLKSTVSRADQILRDKELAQTLKNVSQTSSNAVETINDLRRTSEELRTLLTTRQEDIQRIIADLRRTADNLSAMSSDARDNPSRLILGSPPPRREPGQ